MFVNCEDHLFVHALRRALLRCVVVFGGLIFVFGANVISQDRQPDASSEIAASDEFARLLDRYEELMARVATLLCWERTEVFGNLNVCGNRTK